MSTKHSTPPSNKKQRGPKGSEQVTNEEHLQPVGNQAQFQAPPPLRPGQKRLRVQFDLTYYGDPGQVITGHSQTEPDMTMTVRQMIESAQKGNALQSKVPIYMEQTVPVISDLTDLEARKDLLQRQLQEVKNFIKHEKAEAEAKQKADEEEAARAASEAQPPTPPTTS